MYSHPVKIFVCQNDMSKCQVLLALRLKSVCLLSKLASLPKEII